jgi:hypothetical protein
MSALGPEIWRFLKSLLFGDGALIYLRPLYPHGSETCLFSDMLVLGYVCSRICPF